MFGLDANFKLKSWLRTVDTPLNDGKAYQLPASDHEDTMTRAKGHSQVCPYI